MTIFAKRIHSNSISIAIFTLALLLISCSAKAGLTLQGPSGFIQVPSHRTIDAKEIEMAVHTRMYKVPTGDKDATLSHMAFAFSPLRDFEIGFEKTMNSRNEANDPDPLINFKVRLPAIGSGELTEVAFGGVFDTNPNNYHTLYLSIGGFGLGWNFGGNPWSGMANYGGYDRKKQEPQSLCLLIGAAYPERLPGERGYRGQFLIDYNGDIVSAGWRYSSHRGFWCDVAVHSKSNYSDFYDYRPLIIGLGANF